MKWRDLTPQQLDQAAEEIDALASAIVPDPDEEGDRVLRSVVRYLRRESMRRERAASPDPVDAEGIAP